MFFSVKRWLLVSVDMKKAGTPIAACLFLLSLIRVLLSADDDLFYCFSVLAADRVGTIQLIGAGHVTV